MKLRVTPIIVTLLGCAASAGAQPAASAAELQRGWAALRAMDCARCHGADYDGWAAPSLIASVRDAPRERFVRIVLDGDIGRGMPAYRSQPLVVAELDAIYDLLKAAADGAVDARKGPAR